MSPLQPQKDPRDNASGAAAAARGASRLATPALLMALLLVTLGLRVIGLGDLRFEEDECFYAEMSNQSLEFAVTHAYYSTTYFGWFLPYKAWILLTSDSDVARKSFSLLCGCLSVLGVFFMGRQLLGRRVGLVAALLLALNGYHLYFSRVASPYAFLTLLGTVIIWSYLLVLRDGSRRAAVVHALALGAAFYCHPAAGLLLAAEVVVACVLAFGGRRDHLGLLWLSQGATVILASGAFQMMLHQWRAIQQIGYEPFLQEVGMSVLGERIHNLIAYGSRQAAVVPFEILAVVALLGIGAFSVYRAARDADPLYWPRAALACIWMLPVAACAVAGLLIAPMMLYEARFFALVSPAGVLLMASAVCWIGGLERLGKARRPLAVVLTLAILAPQAGSMAYVLGQQKSAENFPIDHLSAYLKKQAQPGDVALVHHSWYKLYFDRYYHAPQPKITGAVQSGIKKTVPFGGTLFAITPGQVKIELNRLGNYRRLFLILSPGANEEWRDPKGLLEAALDGRYALISRVEFGVDNGINAVVKQYDLGSAPARD